MIWSPKKFFGRKWRLGDRIFPALQLYLLRQKVTQETETKRVKALVRWHNDSV